MASERVAECEHRNYVNAGKSTRAAGYDYVCTDCGASRVGGVWVTPPVLARVTAERDALMSPGIIEGMRRACLLSRDTTPEEVLRHLREVASSYEAVVHDQDVLLARAEKAEAILAALGYAPVAPGERGQEMVTLEQYDAAILAALREGMRRGRAAALDGEGASDDE